MWGTQAGARDRLGFQSLAARATGGSREAFESLADICEDQLMRVIRRRLSPRLRTLVDSTDVRQAIWASMIADPQRFAGFENAENLIAFVSRVAAHKISDQARHEFGRDGTRDRTSTDSLGPVASGDPTPSQDFVARETRDRLTDDADAQLAEICKLRLEDVSVDDIVERTGIPRRQVYRVLERARKRVT